MLFEHCPFAFCNLHFALFNFCAARGKQLARGELGKLFRERCYSDSIDSRNRRSRALGAKVAPFCLRSSFLVVRVFGQERTITIMSTKLESAGLRGVCADTGLVNALR